MDTADGFNIDALKVAIANVIGDPEFAANIADLAEFGDGGNVWYLETVAAGWEGSNQPESIVAYFDMDVDPTDEYVWEEIDSVADPIADRLTEACKDILGSNLFLFFGHCEGDGSYCLGIAYNEEIGL